MLDPLWPAPSGFELHRTGILEDDGPRSDVYAYDDGRAWIRVDVTTEWRKPRLFGALGPLVRPVTAGAGVGYTNPAGSKVAIHTEDTDIIVTGSVDLDALVDVAATIAVGIPIDPAWPQTAGLIDQPPPGVLVPPGDYFAARNGDDLLIAVGGPGATDITLTQSRADVLPPPIKADVVETFVRGVAGRYAPRLGTLTWLDNGWTRTLRSDTLDLDGLLAVAES